MGDGLFVSVHGRLASSVNAELREPARPQAVDGLVSHDAREPGAETRPAGKAGALLERAEIAVLEYILRVVRVADQAQREAIEALVVLAHDRLERGRTGELLSLALPGFQPRRLSTAMQ